MSKISKKAVVLVNLGSPDSTRVPDVRSYLRRFLMDPLVIDIPFLFRWFLVNVVIAPFRAAKSAEAYKLIWSGETGSPLIFHSSLMVEKLALAMPDYDVRMAMRFGSPGLFACLSDLVHAGVEELQVLPMYPQYAMSSTESVLVEVKRILRELDYKGRVSACLSFADDAGFVGAVCEKIEAEIADFKPDHLLLSYHGLPVRHVKKIWSGCEGQGECSLVARAGNSMCYRRQAYITSAAITARLARVWSAAKMSVGFQSRLNARWIQPFSDDFYRGLPKQGVKRLLVACPSFVADCLETLEEVAMRGRDEFVASGGEDLRLVACVNESDAWVQACAALVRSPARWSPLALK